MTPVGHTIAGIWSGGIIKKSYAIKYLIFYTIIASLPDFDIIVGLILFGKRGLGLHQYYTHNFLFVFIVSSIVYLFIKEKNGFARFTLSLIISGAAGNLFDRISKGYVIDFLDFHIGNHHWPSFNLSDSFITVGSLLLILYFLMGGEKKNVSDSLQDWAD